MATPTLALARAGASLMPSPAIATTRRLRRDALSQRGGNAQTAGEFRARRQKIGQGVAIEGLQERLRRLAQSAAQHAAAFNATKPGAGETSEHRQVVFGLAHHLPNGDPRRRTTQSDAAALAADRFEVTLLCELIDHLHQMGFRDIKTLGDLRDGGQLPVLGADINQRAQRIIGPQGKTHGLCSLPRLKWTELVLNISTCILPESFSTRENDPTPQDRDPAAPTRAPTALCRRR